ncbi:MAG TPA: cellulose binding domain-containing protein [Actinocrinis sp.]|jgi:hypothetical protein
MMRTLRPRPGPRGTAALTALCSTALVVAAATGAVAAGGPAPAASSAPACAIDYTVNDWGTGFQASITITDQGPALTGWTLQYSYTGAEKLSNGWNAGWSQSGGQITAVNKSYNGTIASGGSTAIGANFTLSGALDTPTAFTVNGVACSSNTGGTPSPSASPSSSPSSSPSGSPSPTGSAFDQTDINNAVAAPLIAFAAPTSSVPRPGTSPTNIYEAKVLYYLALVELQDPAAAASNGTTVQSALLAQVANLVGGGHEPDADGGLEGWSAAPVAQALLLLKHGAAWNQLTGSQQNNVTLLEAAMGYGGNYAYNDANSFSSGICGFGDFSKTNNPNYEDGYVDVEAAAIQYFGAATWNSMLAAFNDTAEASTLTAAGLTNAAGCFTTAGTAANAAIQPAFVWKSHSAADLMGIWNQLAADTFDLTVTSSVTGTSNGATVTAQIADGTTSPEQGQLGMGHEFDSTDSGGLRSSALYVYEGWMNVTGNRVVMSAIGDFSCSTATSAAQYDVGTLDLVYKLDHGYTSYAQSQDGVLVNDSGSPSDGPVAKGWIYDDDAYNVDVATQGC